jgi:hypothetical protein
LWMGRISGRARWAVILGVYFGTRLLDSTAKTNAELRPLLIPIIIVCVVFCLLTWVAQPMFNLLLRCNRFGRYALSDRQIVASNWFGGLLAAAILLAVIGLTSGFWPATVLAMCCGLMLLPVSASLQRSSAVKRRWFCAATAVLGLIGLTASIVSGYDNNAGYGLFMVFLVGMVAFLWLANIFG